MRLFDTTIVVSVLEKENAPVLLRDQVEILEHLAFFDLSYHEVDVVLSLFKVSLPRVKPNLVKVSMHDFTAKLLE